LRVTSQSNPLSNPDHDSLPLAKAYQASRLYDSTHEPANVEGVEAVLEAERTIASATGEEAGELMKRVATPPVVKSDPDGHDHLWAALVLMQQGKSAQAAVHLELAMVLGVRHWRVNCYLASALGKSGSAGEAFLALNEARQLVGEEPFLQAVYAELPGASAGPSTGTGEPVAVGISLFRDGGSTVLDAFGDLARLLVKTLGNVELKGRVLDLLSGLTADYWLEKCIEDYRKSVAASATWFDVPTFLNWFAGALRPSTYIEIGVRRGRSLAQVLTQSPATHAFGFDLWVSDYGCLPEQGIITSNPGPDFVIEELRRLGVTATPRLIVGSSHDTLASFFADPSNPQQFDLLLVDGDHSEVGARSDLIMAFAHVAPGGSILFDDTRNVSCPGLKGIWDSFKTEHPDYIFIEDDYRAGTAAAFRPPFDRLATALGVRLEAVEVAGDQSVLQLAAELVAVSGAGTGKPVVVGNSFSKDAGSTVPNTSDDLSHSSSVVQTLATKSRALDGLDLKLLDYLGRRNGFFIEAGGNDGVNQSNTFLLEHEFGWKGMLIEPIPALAKQCRRNRPGCIVEAAALVAADFLGDSIEMRYCDLMSLVKGAMGSDSAEDEHLRKGCKTQRIETFTQVVPVATLSSLIDKHRIDRIDLFSLDVEGYEAQALMGLDFGRHAPEFILVEARFPQDIDRVLLPHYVKVAILSHHVFHHDVLYRHIAAPSVRIEATLSRQPFESAINSASTCGDSRSAVQPN
jgi:FkbM family methyltransferase